MTSKTIRITGEDYNRLLGMRTVERKFIKDVITYLIAFYDDSEKMIYAKSFQCPECHKWSNYSVEIKIPQTLEEKMSA